MFGTQKVLTIKYWEKEVSFFDVLLWPINTIIALMGIALASLELQERAHIRKAAKANPETLDINDLEIEISTSVQVEKLKNLFEAELGRRQRSWIVLPRWATRHRQSYFVPLGSRGYVHETSGGIWVPWGLYALRYAPLLIVLVTANFPPILESLGGPHAVRIFVLPGFFLSALWAVAMFTGIYVERERAKPHLICGPFRISEICLNTVEIIEKYEGRYDVMSCVDTVRYPGFQLRFFHANCDLQDAVTQSVSSMALFQPMRSGGRLRIRVSRDFVDPVNDNAEAFLERMRWGLLAFYNVVAKSLKRDFEP